MRVTLEGILKEAYAKVGQELPVRPPVIESRAKSAQKGDAQVSQAGHRSARRPATLKVDHTRDARPTAPGRKQRKQKFKKEAKRCNASQQQWDCDLSVYREGVTPRAAKAVSRDTDTSYQVTLDGSSRPCWDSADDVTTFELLKFDVSGDQVQPTERHDISHWQDRELVLGLDFGSSSAKAVIGDSALEKAFAVPFRNAVGSSRYLLPCRLHEIQNSFSLEPNGEKVIADLKLAYLAEPSCVINQQRIVAFLALVIRQARAWLFSEKEAVYRSSRILWRMAIGFPAANHLDPEQTRGLKLLATAAWIMAGRVESLGAAPQGVDEISVAAALRRAEAIEAGEFPSPREDVELSVIPEIAAQIYGYVASEQFEHSAANNFMMIDVGAGTVDASLFHVRRGKGKWDFEFYTATVEPLGVINLHRGRLNWWASTIQNQAQCREDLLDAIAAANKVTDVEAGVPESLETYFSDCAIEFRDPREHYDRKFFAKVFEQLGHETYWKTSQGHLTREQLTDLPVYLCGGGSRMPFYVQLREALNNHPSMYEWMRVKPRALTLPKRLDAPGLLRADFDRLSVAYGLSFLNLGKVLKSVPKTVIPITSSDSWRDNYIDK